MSLVLDHVSLQTPAWDMAVELLRHRFGLNTTPTPAAPGRHGRVYLDRGYLEIAAGAEALLPWFFLRYEQLDNTLQALQGRGLRARASVYQGVDGAWEDIEIDAGTAVPLPYLVRRLTPPEVARDWPPPLVVPHACGAEALAAVHLRCPRLEPALVIYERLLGSPAVRLGADRAVHHLGPGRIVLHEAAELPPAIVGFELRVASLEHTQRRLAALGIRAQRAGGVLWTELPGGAQLGFSQSERGELVVA
jgi:hypothetical protein